MKEIWVDNISFRPELYTISNTGKLKNKNTGQILKTRVNKYGYEDINVGSRKNNFRGTLHRMVYQAFHLEIDITDFDIHHKDGNKLNNHLDNLDIIKKSDHCRKHSTGRVGKLSPNFKGTVAAFDKLTGELRYLLNGRKEIEKHNFSHNVVSCVISGKYKSHKGHIFKRLTDETKLVIGKIYDINTLCLK